MPIFSWIVKNADENSRKYRSSQEVELLRMIGVVMYWPILSVAWLVGWSSLGLRQFLGLSDLNGWYKIIFGALLVFFGFLTSWAYSVASAYITAQLFGFFTLKRRKAWGSKIIAFVVLVLLLWGLIPFVSLAGGIGLFAGIGHVNPSVLLGLGMIVSLTCVVIPGLLHDKESMEQKGKTLVGDFMESARDIVIEEMKGNPALAARVAFKLIGDGMALDGYIRDQDDILTFLKPYPDGRRTAEGLIHSGYQLLMPPQQTIPPTINYITPQSKMADVESS